MKIAIIGGGAAGMMAAATLIENKATAEVHLFEKNKTLGSKVKISGGGRCNVTTGIRDRKTLLSKYPRGADFLKHTLGKFSPKACWNWFEEHGVPLKNEEDDRVFPISDNGEDVVKIFEKIITNIHYQEPVENLKPINEKFELTTNQQTYNFDFVVITTGGNAFAHTGSTGDGYHFAKNCGHTIKELGPSLNSFETKEDWPKDLSGLSLENAELIHEEITEKGPFLFTHFGITGPVTFALSARTAYKEVSVSTPLPISLKVDSQFNEAELSKELQESFQKNGAKQVINCMPKIPKRLSEKILKICQIDPTQKCAELSKEHRQAIVKKLCGDLELNLIKRRPGDEFVTAGGVSLSEVDPKTMESKVTPNLYFAGEVLDFDGLTGGFNLQSSWATGRLAGQSILQKLSHNVTA